MAVYLIHIDPPLRHSRHYIGYAKDPAGVDKRLHMHRTGRGGVLPRYAVAAGSTLTLAYVWPDAPREFERHVKRHGGASRYCPLCGINSKPIPKLSRMKIQQGTGPWQN